MDINIQRAGAYIIEEASQWVEPGDICRETPSNNKGECMRDISEYVNGKYLVEAYCTSFVWMVVDKAIKRAQGRNVIAKTKSAITFPSNAKKAGIRVDKNPAPGSVFYRTTTAKGSTGHMGVVVMVANSKIYTVEANMAFTYKGKDYEGIWSRYYNWSEIDSRGMKFIHTEEMMGNDDIVQFSYKANSFSNSVPFTASMFSIDNPAMGIGSALFLGGIGYGGYWLLKDKKKNYNKLIKRIKQ